MRLKSLSYGFLAYALAVLVWGQYAESYLRPPLDAEFQQMAIHCYSYFDAHNETPRNLEHLPPELRRLVDDGDSGITWDPNTFTLTYMYPRPYPMNIEFIRILTFNLIPGSSPMDHGRSISPNSIAHNTKIYKDAGELPDR